jgi:hypothetical protein
VSVPPDDGTPPTPPAIGTLPAPPQSMPAPVIPAGQAQQAVSKALTKFVDAFAELEATSMAVARALDATAGDA